MNIDVLNNAIKEYIDENEISDISELCIINNASRLLIEMPIRNDKTKYTKKVSLKKNIKYVSEFLYNLNPEYYEYLKLRLKDGTFIFDEEAKENAYSTYDIIDKRRIIYIPVLNTLEDSFSIVHELMHDMNLSVEDSLYENISRYYFTEGISTLSEYLLSDYLINKKVKDAKVNTEKIIYATRIKAVLTDFNLRLVNHYLENGYVTEADIVDILGLYNVSELPYLKETLEEIVDSGELTIVNEQRYVISSLISSYMYNRININKRNIQELFDMNELIQNNDFQAILDYLGFDYNDSDLTDKSYEMLRDNYKKFVKSR